MALRTRFNGFVERHEVGWELTMGGLALLFVATGFADQTPPIATIDAALTVLFATEFSVRFLAAESHRGYLRSHWIDLIALNPSVRGFRMLRLLRLLRLVRTFSGVYRALGHYGRLAQHRGLYALFIVWAAVMILSSVALYAAENGINEAVATPFDALWWSVVTLTTVGYGDVYPVTPEGRIAAMALMVLGIGLFAAITATITSALVGTSAAKEDPLARLDRLDALLAQGRVTAAEYDVKREEIVQEL